MENTTNENIEKHQKRKVEEQKNKLYKRYQTQKQ